MAAFFVTLGNTKIIVMKALVAKLTGKERDGDPINIHVTVFWATIIFWTVATIFFTLAKALN